MPQKRTSPNLTITPKPFKSSRLALPPSPFSPRLPLTPPSTPPTTNALKPSIRPKTTPLLELQWAPPPPEPLPWLWTCHICNRFYPLAVTRRCLDDGHYFCCGTTTVKRNRRTGRAKVVRHKACASEFDYAAWKAWGVWRRDVQERGEAVREMERLLCEHGMESESQRARGWTDSAKGGKECWNGCDYPSECRWGREYGVQSPGAAVVVPSSPASQLSLGTVFESVDLHDEATTSASASPIPVYLPDLVAKTPLTLPEDDTKKPSMDDLLASVRRRKRRSAGLMASPLASNAPSPTTEGITQSLSSESSSPMAPSLQKAFDDFELDFKSSFSGARSLLSSFVRSQSQWSGESLKDKEELVVKGLRAGRKKSVAEFDLVEGE